MNEGFLKQAKAKAAKYCAYRERAPKQVLDKLLAWDLSEDQAQSILAQLIDEGFVNEERYCRAFCHDKFEFNHWGKIRIKLELRQKGISDTVIEQGLNHISIDTYRNTLLGLATSKWESLHTEKDPWKKKNKVAAYLARKGFETDLVWETINQLSAK